MTSLSSPLDRLRWIGWIETVSFLILLLIAMPLKYAAGMPQMVRVVGSAHGFLVILYCLALFLAWRSERWPLWIAFLGVLASVVPLGPIFFDRWVTREYGETT